MLTSFIITFREALEITLIIGVILRCLIENNQHHFKKYLIGGVLFGLLGSVIGGCLFYTLAGGFVGRGAEIFKGVTQLLGAALLTTVVLWMLKTRGGAGKLQALALEKINKEERWGIFFLTFVSVLKEGVELMVYLVIAGGVFSVIKGLSVLAGAACSAVLGYVVYRGSKKINLKKFFLATSAFLFLFGASLVQGGVYALEEARIVPSYPLLEGVETTDSEQYGNTQINYQEEEPIVMISKLQILAVAGYSGLVLWLVLRKNKE